MLTSDERELHLRRAINAVDLLLNDRLPAGPADQMPPPDWEHWHECHRLMHIKLGLVDTLADLKGP